MKLIVITIPIIVVRNPPLSLFPFVKTKSEKKIKFQKVGGLITRNISALCFFTLRYVEFNRLL